MIASNGISIALRRRFRRASRPSWTPSGPLVLAPDGSDERLGKLEEFVLTEAVGRRKILISGTIREVNPSYYRVAGLSQFVKLGDRVGFASRKDADWRGCAHR